MNQPAIRIKLSVSGNAQVKGALSDVERSLGSVSSAARAAIGPLVGLFSAGAFVGKVAQVQREFDVLNSSLKTVTGSSAAAAREMEWLKAFAKETPFGLNQATQAFVKMKALGLDPSRAALTSYGNTASAMGKDLNQMIEAVADAATGEFERLKEFGVKSKKEGDQVSFTFQGVTTKIGNNAAEITGYLESLGNNQFAGAMAQRANTLDGAIASLGDTWDELFRTISAQNAGTLMHDSVRMAEAAVTDLTTVLRALNGTTADNARQTGAMATVQNGLAIVFETVAVLGANVAFTFRMVYGELKTLAQQAKAVASGELSQAAAIGRAWTEEAKKARAEVDATSARILNARTLQQQIGLRSTFAATDPRRVELSGASTTTGGTAAASRAAQAEAQKAAEADLAFRRKYTLELVKGMEEAAQAELAYQAALDARNFDAAWEADQKHLSAVEARIKAGRTTLEQLQFENSLLAMNTTEREVAIAMRELERQGVVKGTEAYEAYADAIQSAVINREAQREARDFWTSIETTAKDVFTDVADGGVNAFQRIGKTIKASVLDVLWQMTGRQWLISVGSAMGAPGAAMASTATGGGNLLGTAGNLSGAYNVLSNGISASVSAGFDKLATSGFGQKIGLSDSIDFGTGYEQVATNSTGATLGQYAGMAGNALAGYGLQKAISGGYKTGESGLVDAITVAASAYFGPIAGVVAGVFNRAFGRKLTDQGLQGQFGGEAGFTGENYQFLKGGWFRSDKTKTSPLDADMQSGLADQFKAIQVQTALMATVLGDTGQSVADFTSSIKLSFNGLTEAQIGEKLTETFTSIANDLAKTVLGDSDFAKKGEDASQTLQRLSASLTTVNSTFDALGYSLKAVSLSGADAASDFIDLMGGLDAFAATTAGYYSSFYTEAERQAKATEQLTQQLTTLGINDLPDTVAAYRQLVDDAMADGNETLAASLINLSGAFLEVETAATAATNALLDRLQAESATLADFTRSKSRLLLGLDVPGFASGGVHSGGLRIVGENGSELEATGPARYWTASQTASLVNGQGTPATEPVVAELRALRAEVSDLRAEARATAGHTAKTARLLDRAMPDGQSI